MRESNDLAIGLYESLGYIIYRRVQGYYGGGPKQADEDAFGTSLLPASLSQGLTMEGRYEETFVEG